MNTKESFQKLTTLLDSLELRQLTEIMHDLERYYRERWYSVNKCVDVLADSQDDRDASFATIKGKFIDENDWWPDGHVADANISVYSVDDNTFLAGGTTDQNGYYKVSGPFFMKEVRVVATPPLSANCKHSQRIAYHHIVNRETTAYFKDECKF